MFTNLVYVIWSTGETQAWNTPHLMNKSIEEATPEEEKSNKTNGLSNGHQTTNN